jgi:hypothetical protein
MTKEELKKFSPCEAGYKFWLENCEGKTDVEQIKILFAHRFDWANWLIVRMFDREQKIQYAIFAAEQILDIYEERYPGNKKPKEAIEAAKAVLNSDTPETRSAASVAADAAGNAAYEVVNAADAAIDAARAASVAAYVAADAAIDAACATYAAAEMAADAVSAAARQELQQKIIEYGIELLTSKQK